MTRKALRWLGDSEVRTPPFSAAARRQAGTLLNALQWGATLKMPTSRSLSPVGPRVHELRLRDSDANKHWRIIYRVDADAILVVAIYDKDTNRMPQTVVNLVRRRLSDYDAAP